MTADVRARIAVIITDPARVVDVPSEQVAPMVAELVHLLGHLVARLQGQAESAPGPGPDRRIRQDRLLTPEETSAILGVTERWLYRHADTFPFTVRLSRKCLRFRESGVYKYLGRAPR